MLLGAAAVGVLLVGVFPMDGNATIHAFGAVLYLVGGGLGLIALAYAVRPRSEALGSLLALLGLVGTAATVFFLTGVTSYLGEGGTERVAAYVLPIGLALAGAALWRLGRRPAGDVRADPASGARARPDGAGRARPASGTRPSRPPPTGPRRARRPRTDGATAADDTDDDRDPWAAAPRRGD